MSITAEEGYSTVAKICTYRLHARRHEVRAAYAPGISRASHCWPGGGNSSTAPFAVYGKGLSLNTSDRRASCASDRSSHHKAAMIGYGKYTIVQPFRELLGTLDEFAGAHCSQRSLKRPLTRGSGGGQAIPAAQTAPQKV